MKGLYIFAVLLAVAQAGENTKPQTVQHTAYRPTPSISAPAPTVHNYAVPIGKGPSSLQGNFVDDLFRGSGFGERRAVPFQDSYQGEGFGQGEGKGLFGSSAFGGSRGSGGASPFDIGGRLQRGTAQVGLFDQTAQKSDRNRDQFARDFAGQQQSAGREDNQERRGQLSEAKAEKQENKEASKGQKKQESFKQEAGVWNLDSKRQNDKKSQVGTLQKSDGELLRSDVIGNDGSKALGVRKTAFVNGNLGFENVGYGFDKDFNQQANERGGYKEVTGRDDNNVQIYQEKKRDHRLSNSNNEAFRKADDVNRSSKSNKWLQNALQKQDQNKHHGAADKLKDAAAKQANDFKTFFERRDDKIWNAALARDTAFRGAQDKASKNGLYNKDAIARAAGHKGVADNKFYDGAETGNRGFGGARQGGYAPVGYNTAGLRDQAPPLDAYAPQGTSKFNDPRKIGLQEAHRGPVIGVAGPSGVKGRIEASGGDVRNAHAERAVQGDLGNQLSANNAESKADARNNYHRDKGLEDSIRLDQAQQGKWANQREGFRDGRRQGYNGERARASRGGEAVDNSFSDSRSSSNLEAADRGLDNAKLDRINLKKNQVDSKQNIRSKKQFYHDKNQDGFNNEGLHYNRNRGNNDFGAQEAAESEAKTKFSNLHQDSKNSRGQRHFQDEDFRKLSNVDAAFKRQKSGNGNAEAFSLASDRARLQALGFNKNRARKEFDRFQQLNNQRNRKNWDRINHDMFGRSQGKNIGRRVDGAFLFGNELNAGPKVGQQSTVERPISLGKSEFGAVPLGKVAGGYNPYAPQRVNPKQAVATNAHPIDNVGVGIGQTAFGQYW